MSQDFTLSFSPSSAPSPHLEPIPAPKAAPAPESVVPVSSAAPVVEEIHGRLPEIPVMEAPEGIRFDFNEGLRVRFPETGGPWHIIFRDIDTGVILYSQDVGPNTYITSVKKFYVRFRLEIFHKSEMEEFAAAVKKNPYLAADKDKQPKPFFQHDYDAEGRTVMIQLPVSTIGATLGWFPYVEKFRQKHKCHVLAVLLPHLADLLRDQYPEITFITKEDVPHCQPYACYYLGLFFRGDVDHQPCDFRYIGLHRTAGYILGVDPNEEMPRFNLSAPRKIEEPYVCIAVQSSSQAKYWTYGMARCGEVAEGTRAGRFFCRSATALTTRTSPSACAGSFRNSSSSKGGRADRAGRGHDAPAFAPHATFFPDRHRQGSAQQQFHHAERAWRRYHAGHTFNRALEFLRNYLLLFACPRSRNAHHARSSWWPA